MNVFILIIIRFNGLQFSFLTTLTLLRSATKLSAADYIIHRKSAELLQQLICKKSIISKTVQQILFSLQMKNFTSKLAIAKTDFLEDNLWSSQTSKIGKTFPLNWVKAGRGMKSFSYPSEDMQYNLADY